MQLRHSKTFFTSLIILLSSLNVGCALHNGADPAQMANLLLAEPAPMSPRAQLAIARYTELLSSDSLSDQERAELYLYRGMLYDSLGLVGLAQYDLTQAIGINPSLAPAYNSMGVHFTQQQEFLQAYEAFDSTLDIDPTYDFAFLNRGIALYYGGKAELAIKDLEHFQQQDSSDPFRALWAYFAYQALDQQSATVYLRNLYPQLDKQHWATRLVELYLGNSDEKILLTSLMEGVTSQAQLTDRLCEAYFYLGKFHQAKGQRGVASNYFKLALSTNVFDYVEHRYARLELDRLRNARAGR